MTGANYMGGRRSGSWYQPTRSFMRGLALPETLRKLVFGTRMVGYKRTILESKGYPCSPKGWGNLWHRPRGPAVANRWYAPISVLDTHIEPRTSGIKTKNKHSAAFLAHIVISSRLLSVGRQSWVIRRAQATAGPVARPPY